MKAGQLSKLLDPFKGVINRHSVIEDYSNLILMPEGVFGTSPFGTLFAKVPLPIDSVISVNGSHLLSVVAGLPDIDLQLEVSSSALRWVCGTANGRLAARPAKPPRLPTRDHDWFVLGEDFLLDAATLSSRNPALAQVGLYGVVLDGTGDDLIGYSTDNKTIAWMPLGKHAGEGRVILGSPAADLLEKLVGTGGVSLAFDGSSLLLQSDSYLAALSSLPPLSQDVPAKMEIFADCKIRAALDTEIIRTFGKQVQALSGQPGSNMFFHVTGVQGGSSVVEMAYKHLNADLYDKFVLEEHIPVNLPWLSLDVVTLLLALRYAEFVALDHVKDGILVFSNKAGWVFVMEGDKAEIGEEAREAPKPRRPAAVAAN